MLQQIAIFTVGCHPQKRLRHPKVGGRRLGKITFYCVFRDEVLNGAVAGVVGIEVGVVSGVFNLESSGVDAADWRPRHEEH
jgi:hypothetical protein